MNDKLDIIKTPLTQRFYRDQGWDRNAVATLIKKQSTPIHLVIPRCFDPMKNKTISRLCLGCYLPTEKDYPECDYYEICAHSVELDLSGHNLVDIDQVIQGLF